MLRKVRDCGVDGVLVMASCVQTESHTGFEGDFMNAIGQLLDVAMEHNGDSRSGSAESNTIRAAILELLGMLSAGDQVQMAKSLYAANGIQRLVQLWSVVEDIWKKKLLALMCDIICTVNDPRVVGSSISAGVLPCTVHSIEKQLGAADVGRVELDALNSSLHILEMLSSKATCEAQFQAIVDQPMLLSVLGRFASGENKSEFAQRGMAFQTLFNLSKVYSQRIPILEEDKVMKSIKSVIEMESRSDGVPIMETLVVQGQACSLLARLALSMLESEENMELHMQPLVRPLCSVLSEAVHHFHAISESDVLIEAAHGVVRGLRSCANHPHLRRLICEQGLDTVVSLTEACARVFIENCHPHVLHDAGLRMSKDLVLMIVDISRSWDLSEALSASKAPHVLSSALFSISKMPAAVMDPWARCVGQGIVDTLCNICLRKAGRTAVFTAFGQIEQPATENVAADGEFEDVGRSLVIIFDGLQTSAVAVDMFSQLQEAFGCACVWRPTPKNSDGGCLSSAPSFRGAPPPPVAAPLRDPQQQHSNYTQSTQPGSAPRASFVEVVPIAQAVTTAHHPSYLPGRTSFNENGGRTSAHIVEAVPTIQAVRTTNVVESPPHNIRPSMSFSNPATATTSYPVAIAVNANPATSTTSYPVAIAVNATVSPYPVTGPTIVTGTVVNSFLTQYPPTSGNSNAIAGTGPNQVFFYFLLLSSRFSRLSFMIGKTVTGSESFK